MGCIAASSTAIAHRYGRHLPFSYHLGVPYLHIELPITLCALRVADWQPLQFWPPWGLPNVTEHVSGLPTYALDAGHAWAQPGPAFGGGARGPYLRAARAAAAVRASRPARATCSKRVRAVPARPLGSGTCAALPGGGCSGCAGGIPERAPAADTPHATTWFCAVLKWSPAIAGDRQGVRGGVGKLGMRRK